MIAGLIYIDNYEEVLENMEEVRQSLLLALVERKIMKYMQGLDAIIKGFEKDKFLFVFEEEKLEQLMESKFSILDEVRLAQKHMKKLSGNAGHVDIGYVFPLAAHYIPHTVRRFLSTQKNKDVTFNFHQSHTGEMIRGLKNEKYDVIFGSYVEDEPDIQFVPILNQEMIIITPVGHPLSKKEQVSIHDLEHYPLIGYDRTSGLGRFTSRTYTSYTLHPNIICESPDENAIASLVAEDFGIALVADVAILDHFKLEKLHLSDVTLHHTVYLAYLRGHYQIPAVRNFISFIKKEGTSL